jgi:hypothetical protein
MRTRIMRTLLVLAVVSTAASASTAISTTSAAAPPWPSASLATDRHIAARHQGPIAHTRAAAYGEQ